MSVPFHCVGTNAYHLSSDPEHILLCTMRPCLSHLVLSNEWALSSWKSRLPIPLGCGRKQEDGRQLLTQSRVLAGPGWWLCIYKNNCGLHLICSLTVKFNNQLNTSLLWMRDVKSLGCFSECELLLLSQYLKWDPAWEMTDNSLYRRN